MQSEDSPNIQYSVTMDDVLAFGSHFNRTSRTVVNAKRRIIYGVPVCFFVAMAGFFILAGKDASVAILTPLIGSLCMAGLFATYFRYLYPLRVRKASLRVYSEQNNPILVGPRTLSVDENGIHLKTAISKTELAWGALVKVESEPGYTYLYFGSVNAIVIPHASIESGDLRAVLAEVQRHFHPEKLLAQ